MNRPHNYDPRRHYTVDDVAEHYFERATQFWNSLHDNLLPSLGLFPSFDIYFAQLGHRILGRYCRTTHQWPVVLICIEACESTAKKSGQTAYELLESTMIHELGHAIQEWFGLDFNERQAETFARRFYYHGGQVFQFWKHG